MIERIGRRERLNLALRKQRTQSSLSKAAKKELQKRADRSVEKMHALIERLNLNKDRVEEVAQKLKRLCDRLEDAEDELKQCAQTAHMPLEELEKHLRRVTQGLHEATVTAGKRRISKKVILECGAVIKSARQKIRRIEAESAFAAQSLKQVVRAIDEAQRKTKIARDELVRANLRLVLSLAGNIGTGGYTFWTWFRKVI